MTQLVRIRDVVSEEHFELGPEVPALRVPYDAFQPTGPVRRRGALVDWLEKGAPRTGRVAQALLGETHPGERVLVQLHGGPDDEWWLCEIEAIDGSESGS